MDKQEHKTDEQTRRIRRFQIGLNVIMQVILAAVVVVTLNYLAFRYYQRWDFSLASKFTLAEQTKRVIEDIRGEMEIILFFSAGSPIYQHVDSLLKEYQYRGRGKISLELVDPFRNLTRARELQAKYKFGATENILIVDYNGRTKFVNESQMAEYAPTSGLPGELPELIAFRGEEALTSALLEVSREQRDKVYFVSGLGGFIPGEESKIPTLEQYIERQYMTPERLDIGSIDAVPEDADVVIIAGAQYDFAPREMDIIRAYWENSGRVIVLLDPEAKTPRLRNFLAELGVTPRDDRILRTVDMQTVVGILRDVTGRFIPGSPATVGLHNVDTVFIGGTQSLQIRQLKDSENLEIKTLVESVDGFWGESNYAFSQGEPIIFNPAEDSLGPLTVAASIERDGIGDARVQVNSSRMVIVGNSLFITDETLSTQNLDFVLNSINWMVNREDLIGISPKTVEQFNLNLSEDQISRLWLMAMGGMPALAAIAGGLVWLRRRK